MSYDHTRYPLYNTIQYNTTLLSPCGNSFGSNKSPAKYQTSHKYNVLEVIENEFKKQEPMKAEKSMQRTSQSFSLKVKVSNK